MITQVQVREASEREDRELYSWERNYLWAIANFMDQRGEREMDEMKVREVFGELALLMLK